MKGGNLMCNVTETLVNKTWSWSLVIVKIKNVFAIGISQPHTPENTHIHTEITHTHVNTHVSQHTHTHICQHTNMHTYICQHNSEQRHRHNFDHTQTHTPHNHTQDIVHRPWRPQIYVWCVLCVVCAVCAFVNVAYVMSVVSCVLCSLVTRMM